MDHRLFYPHQVYSFVAHIWKEVQGPKKLCRFKTFVQKKKQNKIGFFWGSKQQICNFNKIVSKQLWFLRNIC